MNVHASEHSAAIRSATEEDLDKVLEIEQLSFTNPWTYHCFKIALKDIFFVFEQREIVGYLIACLCDLGKKVAILRIAVHPSHRGKGVAKELLEASLRIFSKDNIEEVELHVNSANRSAVKLYEKSRFKVTRIAIFLDVLDDHSSFYVMKLKLAELKEMKNQLWERFCPRETEVCFPIGSM